MMMTPPFTLYKRATAALMMAALLLITGCDQGGDQDAISDVQSTEASVVTDAAMSEDNAPQAEAAPVTILALGDSLTEGLGVAGDANYPAQLEDALQKMGYDNVKVVNSGLSGETSTGLVNRLDWVAQTNPDITILTIGANDAIRGIDVATVEANIRTAITTLQDNGSEVILGGMQIYDNLGDEYVQSFAAMYPRIARDMDVPLIPFFLEGVAADPALNQADAIHPTKEGYTIIVNNNILPVLKPELEQIISSQSASTAATQAPNTDAVAETTP